MRGVQFKATGSGGTSDMASVRTSDDGSGSQAGSGPGKNNTPDDVDALVSNFLNELDALPGKSGVASDSRRRSDTAPSSASVTSGKTSEASPVFGSKEEALHRGPEATSYRPEVKIDPALAPSCRKQVGVELLADSQDAEAADSRQSQQNIDVLWYTPPNQSPPAAGTETAMPAGKGVPEPAGGETAKQENDDWYQPRALFQQMQERRSSASRRTMTVVLLVIVVAAPCLFYLFQRRMSRPAATRTAPSFAPAPMPAEPSAPVGHVVEVPPSKSSDLSAPKIPAKSQAINTITAEKTSPQEILQIIAPVAISKVTPPYPEAARNLKIFGRVEIEVVVDLDAEGNVVRTRAIDGPALFSHPAEQALLKWRFKPAVEKGYKVPSTVRVNLVFQP